MIAVVSPGQSATAFAVALIEAVDDPSNRIIALSPSANSPLPAGRIRELFKPDFGIGVVVPQVRRPDGYVVEAGLTDVDGRIVSRHLVSPDEAPEDTAADICGTAYPWMAFRRDLLAGAPIDPAASPAQIARVVLERSNAAGFRSVYDPTWAVETVEEASVDPWTAAARRGSPTAPAILVIASFLPSVSFRSDDRYISGLIDDLADLAGDGSVTVAVLDPLGSSEHIDAIRLRGVRTVVGPRDWVPWFEGNWGRFDHVFIARSALTESVQRWLEDTQPQAIRTLCLDSLPSRAVEMRRPVTPPEETAGLEHLREAGLSLLSEWIPAVNAIVCAQAADAAYVGSLQTGRSVLHVPTALRPARGGRQVAEREEIVLMATDGYDAASGSEESALLAMDTVIARLRLQHPELPVAVICDRPSPQLARAIDDHGFKLIPSSAGLETLAGARMLLALHQFGTGGRDAVLAAIEAGTPFVATPPAVSGLDLGAVGNLSVFGDPVDVAQAVKRLCFDDTYWQSISNEVERLSRSSADPGRRLAPLRSILALAGLVVDKDDGSRWPSVQIQTPTLRPSPSRWPSIRPGQEVSVSLGPVPRPDTFDIQGDDRYRLWHERHGFSAAVGQALGEQIAQLPYRPLISVIMPVHNTDPRVLKEAVASVRQQLYDRWELCIADDASTREETIKVLEGLEADPQIRIVRLPANRGISGATNAALDLAEGEFVAFMDHDDQLKPHALAQVLRWLNGDPTLDVIYTDEDKLDSSGRLGHPHLKPDWSPDLLMSVNYMSHLTVIRRDVVEACGRLRSEFDGSQDYDLLLRVTEVTNRIAHVPEPLYSWRQVTGSTAEDAEAKPYAAEAAKRALVEALGRRGRKGWVESTAVPTFYRTRYAIPGAPRVSIIIPTKDGRHLLEPCVRSVLERSTYPNFEILVVDNQSTDGPTLEFLARTPVRVVRYPHRFNYSRQMNLAAMSSRAEVLLFLNNDTEVITPDWIEALLEHAMRPEVGAVGGRLYYTDGKVQHEGILVGAAGGWAWNANHGGYFSRGELVRNASAVTGACTMMRASVYGRIGGNDEKLRIAYNDVDICLRARQAGFEVVYTPYAELFHHEGATRRGFEHDEEGPMFGERWQVLRSVDPYHSPLFLNTRDDTAFLLAL